MFKTEDFDYHLPPELIAQKPVRPRDSSRLLVLAKETGALEHRHFKDILGYLRPGDLLILNNSKVFPARLIGQKAVSGGKVEIFLHKKLKADLWECLVGGRVKEGLVIKFLDGKKVSNLQAEVLKNNNDGTWQVRFNLTGDKFFKAVSRIGLVPLPPYIKRDRKKASDKENYQTVFASAHQIGSVAAPTAGLHFTKSLLKKIKAQGVNIEYVTLHVGLGTFAPVKTEKITEHKMHSEFAAISVKTIKAIARTKKAGGRVIAAGTTSCRTLESADLGAGAWSQIRPQAQSFWTDIFIYPGYKFKVVDALITNFHLPKSTLLMLVSALAGKEHIDKAYQEAIDRRYRFFSYGDAMFIC